MFQIRSTYSELICGKFEFFWSNRSVILYMPFMLFAAHCTITLDTQLINQSINQSISLIIQLGLSTNSYFKGHKEEEQ